MGKSQDTELNKKGNAANCGSYRKSGEREGSPQICIVQMSWVWWSAPVISGLRRLTQEDSCGFEALGLHTEFQDSQNCMQSETLFKKPKISK